jgi:Carboxypeptidase regulatory-like domain/Protein of unknown function (DUF1416)
VIGMATGILFALTVSLIAAACYVGLLLLRRSRPTQEEPTPTVGDLVRRRSAAPDDLPVADDLSGSDLFTPKDPRAVAPVPPPPDYALPPIAGASTADAAVPHPTLRPAATPPGGVEVGDAPWRRAARMMGSEPGGAWETAPIPVVAAAEPAPEPAAERAEAGRTVVMTVPAPPRVEPDEPGPTASVTLPEQAESPPAPGDAPVDAVETPRVDPATEAPAGPALAIADASDLVAAPASIDPSPMDEALSDPTPANPTLSDPTPADPTPADPTPAGVSPADPSAPVSSPAPDAPSRPLSDPDLTPLMGIPIIRPLADSPVPLPAAAVAAPAAAVAEPAAAEPGAVTQPVTPRLSRPSVIDDEVVSLLPATTSLPRAAVTGSPEPVWFRVVRRDGEPVGGALVTLLDDHGQEADATKTATDGGGELHAPHGGWFLMIASAEGFQPRAVTLAVDEQPVEIALLLPRSATVAGVVRADGAAAAGTRVVASQEGEVVDELVTDRDGGYRFDDLAEGVYALSAAGVRGSAVGRVTLSEGADGQLDLDLRWADSAR